MQTETDVAETKEFAVYDTGMKTDQRETLRLMIFPKRI